MKTALLPIQTMDDTVVPRKLTLDLLSRFPVAKHAQMKSGGSFPYLSCADEFNLFVEVGSRNLPHSESLLREVSASVFLPLCQLLLDCVPLCAPFSFSL